MLSNIHAPMALPSVRQLELEIEARRKSLRLDKSKGEREAILKKSWI
jgi:hypothetical protein